jgi:hypothetical protein
MKNLAFIGNGEPPEKLLEIFRKMTPGRSGVWGQLKGVDNYKDADFFAVIDYLPVHLRNVVDESKCVFLGAHPETMSAYRNMDGYKGLKMYDCKKTLGFLEYWLKFDYDYLKDLKPPIKTKTLVCIMSDANSQPYHKIRRAWLEKFCDKYGNKIDVYGRINPWGSIVSSFKGPCGSKDPRGAAVSGGNDHMSGKEEIYEQYRFAIEFDAPGDNYFSERLADAFLMWCFPIYWGGKSLYKYFSIGCYNYLDENKFGEDVIDIIDEECYLRALPYISEARDLILDKYQIWARVHEAIFGESK